LTVRILTAATANRGDNVINVLSTESFEPGQTIKIEGEADKLLTLDYIQNEEGLTISLTERSYEEMAYVIKLIFRKEIPSILVINK